MNRNVCDAGYSSPWVCTQCGVCAAVCPRNALKVAPSELGYRYPTLDHHACTNCGVCVRACPGPRVVGDPDVIASPEIGREVYGPFQSAMLAYATDSMIRWLGSSGGFVTGLLVSLLGQEAIDGAIVTDLGGDGCRTRTFLARTANEVRGTVASKYMISSVDDALRSVIEAEGGRFAVVGTPCQIHGVSRAMEADRRLRDRICLSVGLFCQWTLDYRYRASLVRDMGLREEEIVSFAFRGAGWPGWFRARDRHNRVRYTFLFGHERNRHPTVSQMKSAYVPLRCLLCDDPLATHADITVGDPWNLPDVDDPRGFSLVIIRTPRGEAACNSAVGKGDLVIERPVTADEVAHSNRGILPRHYWALPRIRCASLWARGWRETARSLPPLNLLHVLRSLRVFSHNRWHSFLAGRRLSAFRPDDRERECRRQRPKSR